MKLILTTCALASCSLFAVISTPVSPQQSTTSSEATAASSPAVFIPAAQVVDFANISDIVRTDFSEPSVLANTNTDSLQIGSKTFMLDSLKLEIGIKYEDDTFVFNYLATNESSAPIYWPGSKLNCGLKNYHIIAGENNDETLDSGMASVSYGEISKQDAETMLMVAGEQRQVVQKLSRQKLTDHPATQISNFRWWSVVPLPVEVSDKAQYEFGDLYGEWKSNGDFKLEFQAPFWINSSSVNPHPTALGNSVQIGESTFEVDGLEIKSKISYEAGDVVEHIVVTNISGGGLYWPRKINSRKPYSAISFTIDYSKEKTWSDPDSLVIGLGGGCGGRYGCGPRRKPDASDLDRWFMAPGQTAEFSFRNKFDVQDFREEVYFYSREAIRGIDGIRGATHKFSVPLNYAPDFFPSSSKWDSISFDASFDKEKGYSHVICE